MYSKVLIVGDSFSLLDEKHSHWLKIAGERQGFETIFASGDYGGTSHVSNVSDFLETNGHLLNEVDAVYYFSTDLTRLEVTANWSTKNTIELFEQWYYGAWADQTDDTLPKMAKDMIYSNIYNMMESYGYAAERIQMERADTIPAAKHIYENIGATWLFRANYNSFLLLEAKVKMAGKHLFVSDIFKQVSRIRPDLNVWHGSEESCGSFSEDSLNHYDLETATKIAYAFEDYVQTDPRFVGFTSKKSRFLDVLKKKQGFIYR